MQNPLLPEEIILKLLKSLSASGPRHAGDLYSVCLVSRNFRRIAMPILYSNIHIDNHGQKDALAVTLDANEEFRGLVRSLSVPLDCCHIFSRSTEESEACTIPSMALLNLMPNLQDAEFYNFRTRALPLTFRGPKALLPAGLRNLTSLILDWEDTGYGFGIEDIVSCMCLPSLRRLDINPINNDVWDSHDEVACQKMSMYNASSGVVELTINLFDETEPFCALKRVLCIPKCLSKLSIGVQVGADLLSDPQAHISYIIDGLQRSHTTLESLRIHNAQYQFPEWGTITSLHAFTNLSTLHCDLTCLMRCDIRSGTAEVIQLPASLQILAIVWNRESTADLDGVVEFLTVARPLNLRVLYVASFSMMDDGFEDDMKIRLHNTCRLTDVTFVDDDHDEIWSDPLFH